MKLTPELLKKTLEELRPVLESLKAYDQGKKEISMEELKNLFKGKLN